MKDINDELSDAIVLAKKALLASKEAASIGEFFEGVDSCSDDNVDEIPLRLEFFLHYLFYSRIF